MKLKWRIILAIGVIGIALIAGALPDWMCLQKSPKDITNLWDYDYRQIKKEDHVCLDVTLVWDQIGTQTEEHRTFGVTTSSRETGRYYLLPFCQDVESGMVYPTPYLIMRLPAQYNTAMDAQISKTETWWETSEDFEDFPVSSIHLDGRIEKLPNDMRKQLEASLSPGERLEDYMLPVLFVPIINPGASKVMSIIGILLVMADLVIIFLVLKGASGSSPMPSYGVPRTPDYGGGASAAGNQTASSGTVPFGQAFAGGQTAAPGDPVKSAFAGGAAVGSAFAGSQQPAQNSAFGGPQPMSQSPAFGGGQPTAAAQPFGASQPASAAQPFGASQPAASQPFGASQPASAAQPFGASQPQNSSYSTASLETTQIPYIPGISVGPAPGAPAQSGPSPLGPSSLPGSGPLGPSGGISGPSQSGPSPMGPSSILGSEPVSTSPVYGAGSQPASPVSPVPASEPAPAPAAAEKPEMTEEQAAQIAAMAFGSSQPAMLPLGGNTASVQAASQPATLPLGVSPTQVSSSNSFTMPPAQPENTAAPATPPSPIYGSGPATPPSPIYGSGPATPPSTIYGTAPAAAPEKSTPPAEDENAPLYADNTQMKKVFQGAFANTNNNGNYQ